MKIILAPLICQQLWQSLSYCRKTEFMPPFYKMAVWVHRGILRSVWYFPSIGASLINVANLHFLRIVCGIGYALYYGRLPNLTRAYGNNGRRLWHRPITALLVLQLLYFIYILYGFPIWRGPMTTMAVALDRNLFLAYYSSYNVI